MVKKESRQLRGVLVEDEAQGAARQRWARPSPSNLLSGLTVAF